MDRYITFSNEPPLRKFVTDAKTHKWDKEIKELTRELKIITDLQAVTNSEVHSQNISSPTEKTVARRIKLEQQIERRENYKKIFAYAMDNLTEDEKEIFNGFHFAKKYVSRFVDEYSHKHDCSPRHIYDLKREAEKAFCDGVMMQKGNYITFL